MLLSEEPVSAMGSSLTLAAAATLLVLGVTKMQVAEGGDVEEEGVRVIAGGAKMEDKEEGDGEDEEDVRVKLQEFLQNDESLQKIELLIGWRIRCMQVRLLWGRSTECRKNLMISFQRKLANVYRAVYPHIYVRKLYNFGMLPIELQLQ